MHSTSNKKISKQRIRVAMTMANGTSHEGDLFLSQDQRVSDLLNDEREFLPFELDPDQVLFVRKSSILEVNPLEDAKPMRDNEKETSAAFSHGPMQRDEAAEILGLTNGFGREDVVAAYRAIITKVHPDSGGSTFLASKVNEARATLLRHFDQQHG